MDLIIIIITYYGGLITLGFLTKWYIPVILFLILFGHGSHLDRLFLRKKELRQELNIIALEDLAHIEEILAEIREDQDLDLPGESSALH